jgi:hypothetical protein
MRSQLKACNFEIARSDLTLLVSGIKKIKANLVAELKVAMLGQFYQHRDKTG